MKRPKNISSCIAGAATSSLKLVDRPPAFKTVAHVIKIYPTQRQEKFFRQSCGVARFSFNWALNKWNELYAQGEKPSAYSLIKLLNSVKRTEFVWMQETGKCAQQYAIHNLESAFKAFFKKQNKYPKFKKKGIKDSFVAVENNLGFKQQDFKIWIPRLGYVKCAENLRFNGKVNNVTIKRTADLWFAVVNVEIPNETFAVSENQAIVGVDLGISKMAVTSIGEVFENPKALRKNLRSLKRQQRFLSRKEKGSHNKHKQQMKVARLHYRISCIRKNALHQATTKIVNNASVIVLEDLNVKGMMKNRNLSQAISDVSFGEFRRQIEYKAKWQNKEVIIADRFFASSKTCSCCGHKKTELKLSERMFNCEKCGLEINRDYNAAINLAAYGSTAKLAESNACREGSSVTEMLHSPSLKQEVVSFDNK